MMERASRGGYIHEVSYGEIPWWLGGWVSAWVGGHWVGWVGSVCVIVLLAGNTAKNSIKKQKAKAGWAEEVRWGRGGGVCERKLGRAGGGMMAAVKGPKPGRWPSAVC